VSINLAVAQDVDLRNLIGPDDLDLELRRLSGGDFVSHDAVAAVEIDEDLIGRRVAVAFLDGVEQLLALAAFRKNDEERDVRWTSGRWKPGSRA